MNIEKEVVQPTLSLPDRCYSILDSTGDIVIIQKGERGYYAVDFTAGSKEANRAFADEKNTELGVTKAQEKAMKAGSMFGWTVPAADPQSYDENGKLLCSKPKDRGER